MKNWRYLIIWVPIVVALVFISYEYLRFPKKIENWVIDKEPLECDYFSVILNSVNGVTTQKNNKRRYYEKTELDSFLLVKLDTPIVSMGELRNKAFHPKLTTKLYFTFGRNTMLTGDVYCKVQNNKGKIFTVELLQTRLGYSFITDLYKDGSKLSLNPTNNTSDTILKFECKTQRKRFNDIYKFTLDYSGLDKVEEFLKTYEPNFLSSCD